MLIGLVGLAGLVASLAVRHRSIGVVAARVLERRPDLQRAFGSATMLYSYEFRNLAIFCALLLVGGGLIAAAVALVPRLAAGSRRAAIARAGLGAALLLIIAADLFSFGMPFATKAPASLLDQHVALNLPEPPDPSGSRYASFGDPVALRANLGVLLGLPNVGGYDTIISRDYRQLWSLVEPAVDLPYNQIGRIHQESSLQSPILDLLGVRYILSQTPLKDPTLRLVNQPALAGAPASASVLVYERPSALPHAFVVGQARSVPNADAAFAAMAGPGFQPAREVVLVGQAERGGGSGTAEITSYQFDQVTVRATTSGPAWLVLADANAPGWTATRDGDSSTVLTADGDLRAVYLPAAGSHVIVFKYRPFSLLVGGYVSFLALVVLVLAASAPLWRRLLGHYVGQAERVMRNTSVPMATSFLNKAVDFGFAALMLRILGASSAGDYAFAIALMGYFDIFTNFGLNALITREVARSHDQTGRYLSDAVALRLGLCLLSTPLVLGIAVVGPRLLPMSVSATTAFVLLTLALIPGSLNGAISAVFNAYERNEVPALIAVGTNFLRVALSTVALLTGLGIVGLAAVALFLNLLLAVTFVVALRRLVPPSRRNGKGVRGLGQLPSLANLRRMVGEAYPLLLNNLLVTIFFKIDFPLLEAFQGATVVGYYSAAYKWLDGFLIIPSTLTFAVFPALSRFAEERGDGLRATYDITLRILICLAIPLSIIVTYLSGDLILLLGGPAFYPQSARALAILIWFMPFSFVNGLTQYALIAVNKQKFITFAFLTSAGFNLVANLIFIPRYSLDAASAITVLSEVVLMVPFLIEVRREIGWPNWTRAAGKPALAGLLMVLVASSGQLIERHVALLAALAVYAGAIALLGIFTPEEWGILARLTIRRRVRRAASVVGS
ncbi:MAG TPA: oligosaccharide flippase family protein [Chloroflexota bacterium]|nr:oligosaccharide flippase family protein [Chloroflexota bacterium]